MGRIQKSDGEIVIKNFGIVGLGSIGRRYLRLVKELQPELNIMAVGSGMGERVEEEIMLNTKFILWMKPLFWD